MRVAEAATAKSPVDRRPCSAPSSASSSWSSTPGSVSINDRARSTLGSDGFSAETGGGVTILAMSHWGIPVSTTHTITGAIVGVGAVRRLSAVRWGVAARVVWAWVFTIPASAAVAALVYLPFKIWAS